MKSILFFLVFIANTLYAGAEERDPGSRKRVLVQSFFDQEAEEKDEKRRKKYRLGSTSHKKGGQKTQRTVNKHVVITQEDRARLNNDPSVYKSPPQDDVLQVALNKKVEVAKQVRHPDFLHQQ